MIQAAIVGSGGFAGIEVFRLLLNHPYIEPVLAISDSLAGQKVSEVYPSLCGQSDIEFSKLDIEKIIESSQIAFLAVPHTASMNIAPTLINNGIAVVDLSADFRLHDADVYEKWYGVEHSAKDLLGKARFGQPETHREELRDIAQNGSTPLVACAGCYPTASILAAYPALKNGFVDSTTVFINAMSGVSGAGKSPSEKNQFCNVAETVMPYSPASHRHTPEISQEYSEIAGTDIDVVFIPHLVPMKRGLISTVTMQCKDTITSQDIYDAYTQAYIDETFVHFLGNTMPSSASVVGGNHAQVGVVFDESTQCIVASCAIDNLDKGAASQAIQCANIILGLDEGSGLNFSICVV